MNAKLAGIVLKHQLQQSASVNYLNWLGPERAAQVADGMPPDLAADLLSQIQNSRPEHASQILGHMSDESRIAAIVGKMTDTSPGSTEEPTLRLAPATSAPTQPHRSASEGAASLSSIGQDETKLQNFTSLSPRDQVAMLIAMDNKEAASLLSALGSSDASTLLSLVPGEHDGDVAEIVGHMISADRPSTPASEPRADQTATRLPDLSPGPEIDRTADLSFGRSDASRSD